MMEGRGWKVEGGGWRVEGRGWKVEGGGWRVEGGGNKKSLGFLAWQGQTVTFAFAQNALLEIRH
jgi:hypothetical protein